MFKRRNSIEITHGIQKQQNGFVVAQISVLSLSADTGKVQSSVSLETLHICKLQFLAGPEKLTLALKVQMFPQITTGLKVAE